MEFHYLKRWGRAPGAFLRGTSCKTLQHVVHFLDHISRLILVKNLHHTRVCVYIFVYVYGSQNAILDVISHPCAHGNQGTRLVWNARYIKV